MGEAKVTKMGFEGQLYYGAAGSQASTLITNRRDITYKIGKETGETTTAGNGSAPPIGTARVTKRTVSIEWTMLEKSNDAQLEALKAAAAAGNPVAIRTKSFSTGKGFDGDCILEFDHGKPINGEQTIKFTAEPTDEGGRDPQLHV